MKKEISRLLVIGAGVMGHGIALVCAQSGIHTDLVDTDQKYLDSALSKIKKFLSGSVERKKISQQEADEILEKISFTTDLKAVAGKADLVIEAIIGDKAAKEKLYEQLNALCDPSVIFASNTSQISITELGRSSGRPEKYIGMHWFNPPALMKLIEIPRGIQTSDQTIETIESLAKRLGKVPMVCKDSPGFVVNRILNVWYNEGMRLLDEGAAGVEDGVLDLLLQVGGQPVHVVDGHLEELGAAEVGPVPIGRRHFLERLLHKPRPDAIRPAFRVLVLQGNNAAKDLLGAFEPVGPAGIEQGDGVTERIARRMDESAF